EGARLDRVRFLLKPDEHGKEQDQHQQSEDDRPVLQSLFPCASGRVHIGGVSPWLVYVPNRVDAIVSPPAALSGPSFRHPANPASTMGEWPGVYRRTSPHAIAGVL